jgi:hypothetical protein
MVTPDNNPKIESLDLTSFPEKTSLPLKIQTGLYINEVLKIDESAKSFSAKIVLRLKWKDSRLRFDTWKNGGETLFFVDEEAKSKLETIWQPKIKLANIADSNSDAYVERGIGLSIRYDGTVEYIQDFLGTFKVNFDLTAFPFDTQKMVINLKSQKFSLDKISIDMQQEDVDFSGFNQETKLREWRFSPLKFEASAFRSWQGSLHSQLSIEWQAMRDSTTSITTIFMPMCLILFTNYLVVIYLENEDLEKNVTMISGSLFAIIALDFTVSVNYPALKSNSIIHETFSVAYIFCWLLLWIALTVLNTNVSKSIASRYTISELIVFLRWSMPLILIVVMNYIFMSALL